MLADSSRPQYEAVFAAAPSAYLLLAPDLTIVGATDAYLAATMTVREEIVGRHLFDVFPDNPDDPAADGVRNLRASLERALATSRPDRMPIQKYDIRRPESAGGGFEPHWWSPLNLPVLGPDGTVQHIIHWVEDVTELVELKREVEHEHAVLEDQIRTSAQRIVAETTLRDEALEATRRLGESARRYRFLANAVPELIWTADPTGRVTYGNARWAEVTALRAEEVEGDGWQAALHPDDRASTVAAWTAAVRAGADRFQIEHRIRAGEAGYRWMLTTARPYRDDQGNTTMWLGSTTDIHDRVVAEDQARQTHRLQAVGKLAGGMAHEVNNMMSIVIGLGDLVRRSLGPGHSAASDIDEIVKAGARAAAVTRQLLAFSRQQVLTPTVIDIGAIVRELAPALERVLGADRRLEIVAGTLSWRVVADRMQMEQVLVNLVANARDATETGGLVVVRLEGVELTDAEAREGEGRGGDYVRIDVRDDGAGMEPDVLTRVFEPFFTTKPADRGTGLGLSMVDGVVRHGGAGDRSAGSRSAATRFGRARSGGGRRGGAAVARVPSARAGWLPGVPGPQRSRRAQLRRGAPGDDRSRPHRHRDAVDERPRARGRTRRAGAGAAGSVHDGVCRRRDPPAGSAAGRRVDPAEAGDPRCADGSRAHALDSARRTYPSTT